ncbi:MAG: hypothetical protein AB1626_04685 [Candidatus Micrarchaeota archaeon]
MKALAAIVLATFLFFAAFAAAPETQATAVADVPTISEATAVPTARPVTLDQSGCKTVEKVCHDVETTAAAANVVASQYCEEIVSYVPCEQPVVAPVQGECKVVEEVFCKETTAATTAAAPEPTKVCRTVQKTVCATAPQPTEGGGAAPSTRIIEECPQICTKTLRKVCAAVAVPVQTVAVTAEATRTAETAAPTSVTTTATTPGVTTQVSGAEGQVESSGAAGGETSVVPTPVLAEGECGVIEVEECIPSPECVASQGAEYPRLLCRRNCEGAVGKPDFDVQKCFAWCDSIGQAEPTAASGGVATAVQPVDAIGECVSKNVQACAGLPGAEAGECKTKVVDECHRLVWKQEATESSPVDAVAQCVMARCVNLAEEDYAKCKRECYANVPTPTTAVAPVADVCSQIPDDEVREACNTFKKVVDERKKCRVIQDKPARKKCLFEKIILPLVGEDYLEFADDTSGEKQAKTETAKDEAESAVQDLQENAAQVTQSVEAECRPIALKAVQRIKEFKNRVALLEQAVAKAEARGHDATELRYLLVKYNEVVAAAANAFAAGNCREALETLATADEIIQAFKHTLKKIVDANAAGQPYSAAAESPLATEAS